MFSMTALRMSASVAVEQSAIRASGCGVGSGVAANEPTTKANASENTSTSVLAVDLLDMGALLLK